MKVIGALLGLAIGALVFWPTFFGQRLPFDSVFVGDRYMSPYFENIENFLVHELFWGSLILSVIGYCVGAAIEKKKKD